MTAIRVSTKLDPYITDWLNKILGLDDFEFEYNERSLFILRSLMNINCIVDKVGSLRVKDLKQKALEYKCENRTLCQVLSFMELKVDKIPKQSEKYMEILRKLACLLNLKDLSETSYMMALINLKTEIQMISEQKFELKPTIDNNLSKQILYGLTRSTFTRIFAFWPELIVGLENDYKKFTTLKKKIKSTGIGGTFVHKAILSSMKAKDEIISNTSLLICRLTEFKKLPVNLILLSNEIGNMECYKKKIQKEVDELLNETG